MATIDIDPADRDERLGEAIEEFLALVEAGGEPDAEDFVAGYPDLGDDLREALEGLSLVRGLVGSGNGRRLVSGRRLAGYRIVGELGSGGMGVVYEAVHVDLDRPVALKVLDSRTTREGNGLLRFLNEAKTAAGLHHTHIVPVFDVGHVGGLLYYAMQRIEGSGLDHVIRSLRRDRPTAAGSGSGRRASAAAPADTALDLSGLRTSGAVPWTGATAPEGLAAGHRTDDAMAPFEPPRGSGYYRWVAEVGRQAAHALAYAHRRGVIHRDIKPSNLLVDGRGSIWVADFGLARRMADPNLTHSNALLGTPRYMSPEQSRSESVDERTDVYSLGATLYELLTLRPPFEGKSTAELIEQISHRDPAPPRRADPRIPRDLETIVLKSLAKRLSDRYAGAAELADDLQRFLNYEPVHARRIGPLGRLVRLAQRHPAISAVSTAATILVLATMTLAYVRVVKERDRAVTAEQLTQAELRRRLLSEATLLRFSSVANRRERGLNLLTEAVKLGPDSPQRSRLRDEAIAFLALRDVEQRPDVKLGRNLGIAFTNDDRIVAVNADGGSYTLWTSGEQAAKGPSFPTGPESESGADRPARSGRPGGRRIAVGHTTGAVIWPDSRGVRLFDATTGTPVHDIPMPDREIQTLHIVDSSEGPRLVTIDRPAPPARPEPPPPPHDGGRREPPPPPRMVLWDLRDPSQPLADLTAPRPEGVPAIFPIFAGSPDGDTIATAWFQGTSIQLRSSRDGREMGEIESISPLRSLAFGPFGQLAASGVGAVRMWDVGTRLPLTTITPHQASPFLRFSPDGRVLAVAGFNSADIELWDPAGNSLIAVLSTPEPIFGDLAFSRSGDLLAASQADSVAVWALVDSAVRRRSSALEAAPSSLAFASGGALAVAFWGEAPARIWHAGRCLATTAAGGGVDPLAVYSDRNGGLLAVTMDRFLQLGSSPGARPEVIAELPEPVVTGQAWDRSITSSWLRAIQAIGQSQDGRRIALLRLHEILLWDATQPDRFSVHDIPRMASEVAWMPPPPSPERDKKDKSSPRGAGRGPAGRMPWRQAALSPDGSLLFAVNWAGELHGWKLWTDRVEELAWPDRDPDRLPERSKAVGGAREGGPRPGAHTALALSPDGLVLALGQRDGSIILHDARDGRVIRTIPDCSAEDGDPAVSCLAFAPDGPGLLAAGSNSGAVWLVRVSHSPTGRIEPPLSLPPRRGGIRALDFDDSAGHLAIAGEDKEVQVWDLNQLARELGRLGLSW